MADDRDVIGDIEDRAIVLTVNYGLSKMDDPRAPQDLARQLTDE